LKLFFNRSLKFFLDYLTAVVLCLIFIVFYFSLVKDSFIRFLPLYSLIFFALLAYLIFKDVRVLYGSLKYENRNRLSAMFYVQNTAFTGFSPFVAIAVICYIVSLFSEKSREISILTYNALSSPTLFLAGAPASGISLFRLFSFSLSVPLLAVLCYYVCMLMDMKKETR